MDESNNPPFDLAVDTADDTKKTRPFILKEKTGDMLKYGKREVAKFPRRERQTAAEICATMLKMYRLTIEIEKRYYKKTTLTELDIEIAVLRHLLRVAAEVDYYDCAAPPLSMKKYEYWSRLLDEIGRILGQYIKTFK